MNILYILTDQMHKYALGKLRPFVKTPNLDKLADDGVLFTNAYSNCPICTPFRGNLFTGMYASQSKVIGNEDRLPENIPALADILNENGYNTSFVGKWHLGNNGNKPIPVELRGSFQRFIGYQCYNGFLDDVNFYDENNNEIKYSYHRTDVTTDIGNERLNELANEDKPFFHVVFYQAPHYPEQPSEKYSKMYEGLEIEYPPNYKETDPYTPTYSPFSERPFENCRDYQKYGNNMQEYLREYYAMVSQIDAGVGKLIKTLKDKGIYDDTMILFSSDHGDMQGCHGLKNKCLPYEESAGIPLIAKIPNGVKGKVENTPVSSIDYFHTAIDIAGTSCDDRPGRSFLSSLNSGLLSIQPVFSEFYREDRSWIMVRNGDYKLVVDNSKQPSMLFDMKNDQYEMNNLVDDVEYEVLKNELLELVKGAFDLDGLVNK